MSQTLRPDPVFQRGLPPGEILQRHPGVVEVLHDALLYGYAEGTWELDDKLELYEAKYVHQLLLLTGVAETEDGYSEAKTVYVYPSILHR